MYKPADHVRNLSPRVRRALELYATTAAPTKSAASEAAGLSRNYVSMLTARNPHIKAYLESCQNEVSDRILDMGALLHRLSIQAIDKIADTMENGSNENLRLKAAIDLADRGPQTMKSQKVEVGGGLVLAHADAREIAEAMVRAAEIRAQYGAITTGNDDHTNSFTPVADHG